MAIVENVCHCFAVPLLAHPLLQKWKGCFNSGRVTLVAAPLSNNVNTSKSITLLVHYRSPLQFQTCRQ